MLFTSSLAILFFSVQVNCWFYGRDNPDDWSVCGVFPLPNDIKYGNENFTISATEFKIDALAHNECDMIEANIKTYLEKWLFPFDQPVANMSEKSLSLKIQITEPCPDGVPNSKMNEEYSLQIKYPESVLQAPQVWGAIRGMETFSQLIYYDEHEQTYKLCGAVVNDRPRFKVRGIMIDTSRHFLPTRIIKRQLDLMAQNKLNMLHWHLVDSESFPYESAKFPNLSRQGAYSKRHVYTHADISDIIAYSRIRGIRVMPEFDTPGHTGSWKGQPGLLTECFDEQGKPTNLPNLIDVTEESNFHFLETFFKEVEQVFPDDYIHMGGDEISDFILECWNRNPKVQAFMAKRGFLNMTMLEDYYFERLQKLIKTKTANKTMVFWQEVYDNNKPGKNSIVHFWKAQSHEQLHEEVYNATAVGHQVIASSCWYLNYMKYGADWKDSIPFQQETNGKYYYCDPAGFDAPQEQKDLVLGGIAAMWGEFVDGTNIEARMWPRASAVAERLWSPAEKTKSHKDAWPRMHELRCRQIARGFRIQPINYPDYCPYEWKYD